MPPKFSEDTKLKEKHCRNQLAALFAEVRQKVGSEGLLRCIKRDTVHHLCHAVLPLRWFVTGAGGGPDWAAALPLKQRLLGSVSTRVS